MYGIVRFYELGLHTLLAAKKKLRLNTLSLHLVSVFYDIL